MNTWTNNTNIQFTREKKKKKKKNALFIHGCLFRYIHN